MTTVDTRRRAVLALADATERLFSISVALGAAGLREEEAEVLDLRMHLMRRLTTDSAPVRERSWQEDG